jgi:hypothetical protein
MSKALCCNLNVATGQFENVIDQTQVHVSAFDYIFYYTLMMRLVCKETQRKLSACSCLVTRIRDKINLLNRRLKTSKIEFGIWLLARV